VAVFGNNSCAATTLYYKPAPIESAAKTLFKLLLPAAVTNFRTKLLWMFQEVFL
jgi:hypothetical protein